MKTDDGWNEPWREAFAAEIAPGERILWTGKPDPKRFAKVDAAAGLGLEFGLSALLVLLFLFVVVLVGPSLGDLFLRLRNGGASLPVALFRTATSAISLVAVGAYVVTTVGVLVLLNKRRLRWGANSAYAVTSRALLHWRRANPDRVILVREGFVAGHRVCYEESPKGFGCVFITFRRGLWGGSKVCMAGIENVRALAHVVRHAIEQGFPEPGSEGPEKRRTTRASRESE